MASDSDVEAYLNQLSKKTHRLKQDSQPWEDSVSSLSGTNLSAASDPSFRGELRETKKPAAAASSLSGGGLISDISALSEKYSFSKTKKFAGKSKFSLLEEKYLKKSGAGVNLESVEVSKETKQRNNSALTKAGKDKLTDRTDTNSDIYLATKERKTHLDYRSSSEEITDENLAHYLSEVTLMSKNSNDDDGRTSDSMEEVLNLKNVIDVEDILGEEANGSDSVHLSPSQINTGSNDSKVRETSQPENRFTADSQRDAPKVARDEETEPGNRTNILFASKSSLFYSSRQKEEDEDEKQQLPARLLLAQAGDVFHSSRRKSSVEFNMINENKSKPQSSKQRRKGGTSGRHKSEAEGSALSASESHISEQFLISEAGETHTALSVASEEIEESAVPSQIEEVKEAQQVSSSASTVKSKGKKAQVIPPQAGYDSGASLHKRSRKRHDKRASSTKGHDSVHGGKDVGKQKQKHDRDHKRRKSRESSLRKHKSKRNSHKSKMKHRSPSSSSSSSTSSSSSSSSSELSNTSSESVRHKSHSHRRSGRRATHSHRNCRSEPPFLQHCVWPCCCLHANPAATTAAHTLPGFTGGSSVLSCGGVGVEEVMQQQVALVRQFLDSQQVMYQAYTSTLVSSFRYTSLRRTEKYMKKRKQPLSFPEAYRLVKEEMEASER